MVTDVSERDDLTPSDSPREPDSAPAQPKIPGCSGDTCCVKCAPQEVPWQMPAPVLIAYIAMSSEAMSAPVRRLLIEWPPTLPLGQPASPLACGTLLIV